MGFLSRRHAKRQNRWLVLDQSFLSLFISFTLIKLTYVGADLIDGIVVSKFIDEAALAAIGLSHTIFSISGTFAGMFAAGMQAMCTRELGQGNVPAFNRIFSVVMYFGRVTGF